MNAPKFTIHALSFAMVSDPVSSILSLVRARAVVAGGFTAGVDWGLRFPPPDKIKFFIMARGESQVRIDGVDGSFHLREGDVFLLRSGSGFVIASHETAALLDAEDVFDSAAPQIVDLGGQTVLFLGGHVDLDPASGDLLLGQLPATLHIPADRPEANRLGWLIEQLVREHIDPSPGADQACAAIAQLMFLELFRTYIAQAVDLSPGWVRAVVDSRLAPALRAIHSDPSRDWSVEALARTAAMSRTAFAVRFKAVTGVGPLRYLTDWRMRLARRALREGASIATLAPAMGYASEAAFSTAFKRVSGMAPKAYRASARQIDQGSEAPPLLGLAA